MSLYLPGINNIKSGLRPEDTVIVGIRGKNVPHEISYESFLSEAQYRSRVIEQSSNIIYPEDYMILCNAEEGEVSARVPNPAKGNYSFIVKKTDSTSNIVRIFTQDNATIEDDTEIRIDVQNNSVALQSDGSKYHII